MSRAYTGAKMVFNLVFLAMFFIPLALKTLMWFEINSIQSSMATNQSAEVLRQYGWPDQPCLAPRCEQVPAIFLALGGLGREWYIYMLTVSLLVYNALRLYLTWHVAPLRDEEARTQVTPQHGGVSGYGWLVVPHWIVLVLMWVAIASGVWNGIQFVQVSVYVPAS